MSSEHALAAVVAVAGGEPPQVRLAGAERDQDEQEQHLNRRGDTVTLRKVGRVT